MGNAFALGDSAAARAVETDRVDLVEIGDGTVLLGDVADGRDRRHVAIHAVDALEGDDLRTLRIDAAHELVEMRDVVVAEDEPLRAGAADALDHRIVVERIGEDGAVRHGTAEGRQRGQIRDPARR